MYYRRPETFTTYSRHAILRPLHIEMFLFEKENEGFTASNPSTAKLASLLKLRSKLIVVGEAKKSLNPNIAYVDERGLSSLFPPTGTHIPRDKVNGYVIIPMPEYQGLIPESLSDFSLELQRINVEYGYSIELFHYVPYETEVSIIEAHFMNWSGWAILWLCKGIKSLNLFKLSKNRRDEELK